MNYIKIITTDIANGPGVRVSLFVSGCEHKCPGCFNPELHNPNNGKLFDDEIKKKMFTELEKKYCSGLSLLGGDPLSKLSDNRKVIANLCKEIKEIFPNKTIWLWTGDTLENLKNENDENVNIILANIDVLVDGPFIENKKNLTLEFRGSSNQRILYRGKDF